MVMDQGYHGNGPHLHVASFLHSFNQYKMSVGGAVGGAVAGTATGAAIGAMIGSIVPVAGTIVGPPLEH